MVGPFRDQLRAYRFGTGRVTRAEGDLVAQAAKSDPEGTTRGSGCSENSDMHVGQSMRALSACEAPTSLPVRYVTGSLAVPWNR